MSWNVTDHEGRKCYERDGMRVFRTQDIDAINREEQREANEIRNLCARDYIDTECDNTDTEEMKPQTAAVILALFMVAMLCLMFGVGK